MFNFVEEEIKESEVISIHKKKALTMQNRKVNLTVNEQLYMLLVERSSELVLCFLDKHDIDKVARGNHKGLILAFCSFCDVGEQCRLLQAVLYNIQVNQRRGR